MAAQLDLFAQPEPAKRREYDHFPTNKHRQHLARLRGLEVSPVTGEYVPSGLGIMGPPERWAWRSYGRLPV